MFRLRFSRRAHKALSEASPGLAKRLNDLLAELKTIPVPYTDYDVVKMKGYRDTYRIRIGDIRVVYEVNEAELVINIEFIGFRGKAYGD
jgi:mRNA interferase RelE/StbE